MAEGAEAAVNVVLVPVFICSAGQYFFIFVMVSREGVCYRPN